MRTLRVIPGDMARKEASPEARKIAARIREKMDAKGWKTEHLAVHSGVPFSTLATYVATDNPAELKATRLALVCRALGCSADEILGLTAPVVPEKGRRTGTDG